MTHSFDPATWLYETKKRFEALHGEVHPSLTQLPPDLLAMLLEMALDGELELDEEAINQTLAEVDDRVRFLFEESLT